MWLETYENHTYWSITFLAKANPKKLCLSKKKKKEKKKWTQHVRFLNVRYSGDKFQKLRTTYSDTKINYQLFQKLTLIEWEIFSFHCSFFSFFSLCIFLFALCFFLHKVGFLNVYHYYLSKKRNDEFII